MIYNEFHGKRLSALGLGCMRLPGGGVFVRAYESGLRLRQNH